MFRLSKLTDYGIVLLAHLASSKTETNTTHNARELALQVELPVPVVSKVLKALAREQILESQRGSKGGYSLARRPEDLSVAEMIRVLQGPVALTECNIAPQTCQHESSCAVRGPWQVINNVVQEALARVSLADLIDPGFPGGNSALEILGRSVPDAKCSPPEPFATGSQQ